MPLILQDPDSETAVLNGVLADQEALDEIGLVPEDFTDVTRSAIFRAMVTVHEAGRTVDIISVSDQLRVDKSPVQPSTVAHLSSVTAANIAYYAGKVRELSTKRRILAILRGVKDQLEGNSAQDVIDSLDQKLTDLVVGHVTGITKIGSLLHSTLQTVENLYQHKGQIPGLSTGFPELDQVLAGLQAQDLIVIGARPSQGKTSLAFTMALNQACAGKPVGFFSAEMPAKRLVMRALSGLGRVNSQSVATGLLREADFARLMEAGGKLYNAPLYLDDTPNISLAQLRSRARKMRRLGVVCIYIDYLTLIRHGDNRTPRYERVGEITKSLKNLARELDIPIVALSQVGREAEGRLPTMADLRQSGEIEEDADVIIFIHRDRNSEDSGRDRLTIVDVAKDRNAATETIQLIFIPEYVRFESKAHERSNAS
jgi:replicative DNA helicase